MFHVGVCAGQRTTKHENCGGQSTKHEHKASTKRRKTVNRNIWQNLYRGRNHYVKMKRQESCSVGCWYKYHKNIIFFFFLCNAPRSFMSFFLVVRWFSFILTNWNSKHVSCGVTAVDLYLSIFSHTWYHFSTLLSHCLLAHFFIFCSANAP